jgi:hypothetical protein
VSSEPQGMLLLLLMMMIVVIMMMIIITSVGTAYLNIGSIMIPG